MIDFFRKIKFAYQRVVRGYDDTAYWNLDSYITDIALPVLKYYRYNINSYPAYVNSSEEWKEILDKMIKAFQLMKDENTENIEQWSKDQIIIKEGLLLFAEYFGALWD